MQVIHVENQNQFIGVMGVPCGAIHEPKHLSGISHLLEHMLFKSKGIVKNMTNNGILYNAHTSHDYTLFFVICDAKYSLQAFKFLKNIVSVFSVTPSDFEKEKKVVLEELALVTSFSTLSHYLHKGTPYESRVIGNKHTLEQITLKDVKNYYEKHYTNISTLVMCHPKWEKSLRKEDLSHSKPDFHYMNFNTNRVLDSRIVRRKSKDEVATSSIGFLGYPASDPQNMTCEFAAYILNKYLFEILREKHGYVYSASCKYFGMMYIGYFKIKFYASGNSEQILKIIGRGLKYIKSISKDDWDKEYESFKKYLATLDSIQNINLALRYMHDMLYHRNTELNLEYNSFIKTTKKIFVKEKCAFIIRKEKSFQKGLKTLV